MPDPIRAASAKRKRKKRLGWREWVSFPEWGIAGIRSKVDTGARTSALHAIDLEEVDVDGVPSVRFLVQCERYPKRPPSSITLPVTDNRQVRDSSGNEELRSVVVAEVEVRGYRKKIEVTLTRRDDMEFNMLLGRRGIAGRFFVDPQLSYLGGDPPARRRQRARTGGSKQTGTGTGQSPAGKSTRTSKSNGASKSTRASKNTRASKSTKVKKDSAKATPPKGQRGEGKTPLVKKAKPSVRRKR